VHDARHAAATLLLAQGVDQRVVMEILGHSQISKTAKYAHVLPEVMTDAADRIGQALWAHRTGQLQLELQLGGQTAQRSDKRLHVNGCAARDSNPEPAD
jgi:hypothetical protein